MSETIPITFHFPRGLADRAYGHMQRNDPHDARAVFSAWLYNETDVLDAMYEEVKDRLSAFVLDHNELAFLLSVYQPGALDLQFEDGEREKVILSLIEKRLLTSIETLTDRANAQSNMFDMFLGMVKETGALPDAVELHDHLDTEIQS